MDSTLLHLFTPEEILERLARKEASGTLHLFTAKESANLFLRDGILVAAAKGMAEGEEVLRQILTWTGANASWQPESSPSTEGLKPVQINIADYLAKRKSSIRASGKITRSTGMVQIIGLEGGPQIHSISAHAKAATTMPISVKGNPTPTPVEAKAPIDLGATKSIDATAKARSAQEEALLKKYPLTLISLFNTDQRIPIARASSLVGRNPACDITLAHASISRQHCLMQITDRGLHVKDLGTTNGTKVNGIPLTEGYINVGDKITIGHLAFELAKG